MDLLRAKDRTDDERSLQEDDRVAEQEASETSEEVRSTEGAGGRTPLRGF